MSLETTQALVAGRNVYTWEPPNRVIAARYGLDERDILRFDTNTSPGGALLPAGGARRALGPAAARVSRFHLCGARGGGRRPTSAPGPTRILVGCGADEVLDIIAKTFLAPGPRVGRAGADLLDVRGAQRPARCASVEPCRDSARRPATPSTWTAMTAALADAAVVWLCAPNNPTGTPESRGGPGGAARRPARRSPAVAPSSSSTRPTSSSTRARWCHCASAIPRSSWCARCPRRSP